MSQQVAVYRDRVAREFHYVIYTPGTPGATKGPTACGRPSQGLTKSAPFAPGDPRGSVHYTRACDTCRDALTI